MDLYYSRRMIREARKSLLAYRDVPKKAYVIAGKAIAYNPCTASSLQRAVAYDNPCGIRRHASVNPAMISPENNRGSYVGNHCSTGT